MVILYHVHMRTTVKIPPHVDSPEILGWLRNHVGECDPEHEHDLLCGRDPVMEYKGRGWRYDLIPQMWWSNGDVAVERAHMVTFDSHVSADVITQFTLTWT